MKQLIPDSPDTQHRGQYENEGEEGMMILLSEFDADAVASVDPPERQMVMWVQVTTWSGSAIAADLRSTFDMVANF
jgi:hypothetical protein